MGQIEPEPASRIPAQKEEDQEHKSQEEDDDPGIEQARSRDEPGQQRPGGITQQRRGAGTRQAKWAGLPGQLSDVAESPGFKGQNEPDNHKHDEEVPDREDGYLQSVP